MKESRFKGNRIFQIVYPLLVYIIIYQVAAKLFITIMPQKFGALFGLFLAAYVTYPFIFRIYRKAPIVRSEKLFQKSDFRRDMLFLIAIILVGICANLIISHTPLVHVSEGYKAANRELFDGVLWVKILTTCVMIPILEETLFRGIIAGQLDLWYGHLTASIVSAILFGAMHFNIVQLIYAVILGVLLGYCFVTTKKLWLCILSHGLLNLTVVLITTFIS